MKLYIVQAIGPNPARYRGLIGTNDAQAIIKAQERHVAAGFPLDGHQFKITASYQIICNSVTEQPADAQHELHLTDSQLAEIEIALLERIALLEERITGPSARHWPGLPAHQQQLKHARAALALVMAV